ncbi:PAS domain-containing sensor histidine kinase [Chondrinema litorale]|uniref:PAS domain-containing sensor histidine kinase n=1 Tax=Chondrinema litorale TaxID=2994555 RepID=UPI0025431219|nr:PAS domain S-box protein [Chondrinema litorale]UZR98726.1 PAS domain S-box protein [Chondrinema litorale]
MEMNHQYQDMRYQLLLENASIGIWQFDERYITTFINSFMASMIGSEPAHLYNKSLFNFMEEGEAKLAKSLLENSKNKQSEVLNLVFKDCDGKSIYTRFTTSAILDNEGKYLGFLAFVTDETEKIISHKNLQKKSELISYLQQGVSSKTGIDFFNAITIEIARSLGSDYTFIGQKIYKKNGYIKTISYAKYLQLEENFEYSSDDTPCKNVISNDIFCVESGAADIFPEDKILKDLEIEGYVGVPLHNNLGKPIGLLVVMFKNKIEDPDFVKSILQIFSVRAGAELERLNYEKSIKASEVKYKALYSTLQKERKLLRYLIDTIPDLVFYKDPAGQFMLCNQAFEKFMGYTEEDLLGKSDYDFFPKATADFFRKMDDRARDKKHIIRIEEFGTYPDGKLIILDMIKSPLFLGNKFLGVIGIGRDITTQKKVEKELRKSEEYYRIIFESSNDGLFIIKHSQVVDCNLKAAQIIGKPREEIIGKNIITIALNNTSFESRKLMQEKVHLASKGEPQIFEISIINDGDPENIHYAEISLTAFKIEDESLVLALLRDITLKKEAEAQIKKHNIELEKTNVELDNFVYSVSHDLRAPITSALGLIEIAKHEKDDSLKAHYMSLQEKSLHRLDSFIQDILDYSRNSRMGIASELIDFEEIISEIFADFNYMNTEHDVERILEINGSSDFYSDKRRLKVIFNNLISNAIRYSNSYRENSYLKVRVVKGEKKVVIRFIDNGIGISSQHLNKIFDMFYRATQKNNGSGLGLYIVKETVDKLEGNIDVNSQEGEGTEFVLTVPNLK